MTRRRRRGGRPRANRGPRTVLDEHQPTTPFDDRTSLPLEDREVRREILPNGTVVLHYDDPPLGSAPHTDAEGDWDFSPLSEPLTKSPSQQARELDEKKGLR